MTRTIALLGAGASVEAGVPAAVAMTSAISDLLHREARHASAEAQSRHLAMAFDVVSAALSGAGTAADIERVATAVQFVAQRREFEIAPLISSWTDDIEALDTAQPG